MSTLNDLQLSPREVQRFIDEIRLASQAVPYGKNLLRRALQNFRTLPKRFMYSELTKANKHLVSKCQEAYLFLSPRVQNENYWIGQHENARKRIAGLLSITKEPYRMSNEELEEWCDEVFVYLKKFASRMIKRKVPATFNFQLCVDAVYQLVEVARDFDDKARALDYYDYLIKLCQRSFLSPSNFVIPFPTLSERHPNETGASATVHHGYHAGKEVAVKSFRLYYNSLKRIQKNFLKETFILRILYHPNVVPFVGVVQEPHRLCIVLPWMNNGNIVEYLKVNPHVSRKELIEQVADGLHFMYEYRVVHGDLKGANVLIDDNGKACISDFGVANLREHVEPPSNHTPLDPARQRLLLEHCETGLEQTGRSRSLASGLFTRMSSFSGPSGAGTYRWMAPERLDPDAYGQESAKATFSSDVFSFAMLAIEVYTGQVPWYSYTQEIACMNTIIGRRPSRPPDISDEVWGLIEECWKAEPSQRPSMLTAYNRLACTL